MNGKGDNCSCKHKYEMCIDYKESQKKCPCNICLTKVICETKCNEWLLYWIDVTKISKPKTKRYIRGIRYV
ncbi:MAG: hypothetical protein ACFFG0_03885 [Candidatus Thorarchaeota archaeon]